MAEDVLTDQTAMTTVKILCVDDEENILRALKRVFVEEDYDVYTATSGEEGLALLKENPDMGVIISDQRMPGLTGVDFLQRSRAIAPDAVRIVLTGYADVEAAVEAINRGGAYRYLQKPWKDEELLQTVGEAVNLFQLVRENERLTEIVSRQNEELKNWNAQLELYVQEQTMELQRKSDHLAELNKRLKGNFKQSIMAFSGLLELRDVGSRSHARNVTDLAVRVARAMHVPSESMDALAAGAVLHDIGKIGIPDVTLQKDVESLSDEELKEYRLHPIRGQTAIDSIEDLRPAGVLIRHHHERFDGKGFPDGLKGDEIPLGARIIGLADFADRRIRKTTGADPIETVIAEISAQAGKAFDPAVCTAAITPVREQFARNLPRRDMVEMELEPDKLDVGMVISRDVRSGTGLLLLSKGMKINEKNLQALKRYARLDPSRKGVFVFVER